MTSLRQQLDEAIDALVVKVQPSISNDFHQRNAAIDAAIQARAKVDALVVALVADREKYHELLYCVGNKYLNETRHETAKRYLLRAEAHDSAPADADRAAESGEGV